MNGHFQCLCCGSDQADGVYLDCPDYYLRTPFEASYYRCRSCGLLQQSPVPADVSAFYQDYPVHTEKSWLHRLMRKLVLSQVYYRPEKTSAETVLLDYGCGDGAYLAGLKNSGMRLLGYEPSPPHAEALKQRLGLSVYSDLPALLRDFGGSVDVVTMHFVLEHLTDLHAAFQTVRRLLKTGGTFYFVIPDPASLEAKLFGTRWHGLDPPRHISFPEMPVIRRFCSQYSLQLCRHRAVAFPNGFAGSVPAVLLGRFAAPLYLASLPAGIVFSHLFPAGCHAYWLTASAGREQINETRFEKNQDSI